MSEKSAMIWMWAAAYGRLERAECVPGRSFDPVPVADRGWEPAADIYEIGDQLLIEIALPGVEARSVVAELTGGAVHVAGERRFPALASHAVIRRLELPHGRFERRIQLPTGRYELIDHRLADGCLSIVLVKRG